jgi:phospholipase C
MRRAVTAAVAVGSAAALTLPLWMTAAGADDHPPVSGGTASPIKHLVVIFQENVSFDHYFGTYPKAANTSGQPFKASDGTPSANGLANTPGVGGVGTLLTNNPNHDASVPPKQVNPQRYDPANINDVLTCDQDHNYPDEQKAFDGGAMDKFVTTVGTGSGSSPTGQPCNAKDVMNYYDGNTVTGLWNYAQNFAMSDNSFNTTFGPSSPGAINLVSGNTGTVDAAHVVAPPNNNPLTNGDTVSDGKGGYSLVADAQPYYDDCSTRDAVAMKGANIGDELNAAGLSWGWFQGGFRPTTSFASAKTAVGMPGQPTSTFIPDQFKGKFVTAPPPPSDQGLCNTFHPVGVAVGGTGSYGYKDDYIPHHEPFQYYASTANPHHLAPASVAAIGTDTQTTTGGVPQFNTANHQYDMSDFDALVGAISHGYVSPNHLPAVSFLKAPGYQDGHAGYSDPLDEQQFVTQEINALQHTPDWSSTAVVVSYDDSDGWYDHVYSGIHNTSNTSGVATPPGPQDFLTGTGLCGDTTAMTPLAGQNGRCGYGPRLPLLVISPWARQNYVDHTLTSQTSITKFVEDNWKLARIPGSFDAITGSINRMFDFRGHGDGRNAKLFLDPVTGQPFGRSDSDH